MRVVAAMSGGVDSAVAAARMLDAGHEVVGVHLALSQSAATLRESARGCCTLEDAGDARRVADRLSIPFYVWDLAERFRADVVEEGDATVIHVTGEIDLATCERLRDAIEPHLGPAQTIVLDLSGVAFMDSACLGILVQARGRLTSDGGSLVLRNPSNAARRLLSVIEAEGLIEADAEAQRPDSS